MFITIEEKYGVEQGDDWLEVYLNAPFKRGDRVRFSNDLLAVERTGTVIDVEYCTFIGNDTRYNIRVKYDRQSIPRWTHPQWLNHVRAIQL
jgi:hypothetical protein